MSSPLEVLPSRFPIVSCLTPWLRAPQRFPGTRLCITKAAAYHLDPAPGSRSPAGSPITIAFLQPNQLVSSGCLALSHLASRPPTATWCSSTIPPPILRLSCYFIQDAFDVLGPAALISAPTRSTWVPSSKSLLLATPCPCGQFMCVAGLTALLRLLCGGLSTSVERWVCLGLHSVSWFMCMQIWWIIKRVYPSVEFSFHFI